MEEEQQGDVATLEDRMAATGTDTEVKVQEDYFGFDVTHRTYLPDGTSYIEHKELTEGDRRKYLNQTNRDVRIARATQDMHFRMAAGDDRRILLELAIVGWNLQRKGEPVPFKENELKKFLDKAPPKIVDLVEKDIRKHNEWLMGEATIEDIDRQIDDLKELREQLVERDQGKDSSSDR